MNVLFGLLWFLMQGQPCQDLIVSSQPAAEVIVCPSPVTTYISEVEDGWQIDIWDNAALQSTEPLISLIADENAPQPDQPLLLDSYHDAGRHVLLYQDENGAYNVLAGPDAQGQMLDLMFTLPPEGDVSRQDFALAE